MDAYPDNIPLPALRDGRFSQSENLVVDQMAGGNFKARRRWDDDMPTVKEFVWRLRAPQAAMFEGWVKWSLQRGLQPFLMTITTPTGRIAHEVQLLSNPLTDFAPLSELLWEYKARAVIRRRAGLSETETLAALLGDDDTEITDAVDLIEDGLTGLMEMM